MERSKHRGRVTIRFRPQAEAVEGRVLLSLGGVATGALGPNGFLNNPPGFHVVRPNTPVLPFGAPLATATFIDTSAHVLNGNHTVVGQKSFVGPYATLDSTTGFIKIGTGSDVLDNARIISNTPNPLRFPTSVRIGDSVSVGYGAEVLGPSTIGAYGAAALPTAIGPNAQIDGATIAPGAVVGALARVGPGVVIGPGTYVLPGANVTTQAQATNPALGQVMTSIPASVESDVTLTLTRSTQLAAGYTTLYQGNSATGVSLGVDPTVSGVFSGNLAAVEGTSQEPGPTSTAAPTGINFEPSRTGPKFPGPYLPAVEGDLYNFPARVTGDVRFKSRAHSVARHLGRGNAFRADQGQPITFNSYPTTGNSVTINSPLNPALATGSTKAGGAVTFGSNFLADSGAVILGGPAATYTIGDNVHVGLNSVVSRSSIGSGATIGAMSYVANSTVAPGTVVLPNTVLINNQVVGRVQW